MKFLWVFLGFVLIQTSYSQVKRVGGDYIVSSIESLDSDKVRITFRSAQSTGSYDQLVLVSDHVHMGIQESDRLRISAEVVEAKPNGISVVSQVLVFLPSRQGPTPVWMLSKTHPPSNLSGAKLLEMHAPSADYQVF